MFDRKAGLCGPRRVGTCVVWILALFVLSLATPSVAQITTATVIGTVTDSSGAAVPSAEVTIVNAGTNQSRTVESNSTGQYRFELLPIGDYVLDVTATGFKKYVQKGIVLTVNEAATVDLTLTVGSVSDVVNVEGAPPTVNTANAEVGDTVENADIINAPLVNRNVYSLMELVPGYQSGASSITPTVLGFQQQITFFNGGANNGVGSVAYYLDGGLNMTDLRNTGNAIPSPDAIQEFRVQTNSFSAAYGRTDGTIVNVITKSGANDIHGSVFEFVRNTILNANTYGNAAATPPFHRNQYGGTLGGPIRKNKLFFFASYDGLRQITPTFENNIVVPFGSCSTSKPGQLDPACVGSAAGAGERGGDFSNDLTLTKKITITDPVAGGPAFTGNVIPASMIDPTAAYIIANYIPIANQLDSANGRMDEWQGFLNPTPNNYDEGLGKIDYQLTSNQLISGDFFFDQGFTAQPAGGNLIWGAETFAYRQQNINLSHTWTISADKINQAWISYTRNFGGRLDTPATSNPASSLTALTAAACGSTVSVVCSAPHYMIQGTPDLPQIAVTGGFTLGEAISGPTAGNNVLGLRDVFNWTHGRHSFQFGGEVSHTDDKQQTLLDNYGVLSYSKAFTGSNLADFVTGLTGAQEQDAPVTPYIASYFFGLFVQDDFRVTSRLTFNLGLRWDVQTAPTDSSHLGSIFSPGVQSTVFPTAPLGELVIGDPGVPAGLVNTRWHHVQPRLGLAWDPRGDGKTAIRAGFGVFYGSVSGNEWNLTSNFEPFAVRLTPWPVLFAKGDAPGTYPTLTNPYNGFPGACIPFPFPQPTCRGSFTAGGSMYGVSQNYQWPYSYEMNLSAQHEFRGGFTLGFAYVGNLSHDLPYAIDNNYPTTGCGPFTGATFKTCSVGAGILTRRPIDNLTPGTTVSPFGIVGLVSSNQTANYNALQVTFSEKLGKSFTLKGYYVYSKNLESAELDSTTTNAQVEQDGALVNEDRGPTDFDIRHTFAASFVWQLNYYHGSSGALRWVVNGWDFSPIVTAHSGIPFNITSGTDFNGDGNTNDRPDFVPGVSTSIPHPNRATAIFEWFNTAAFCPDNGGFTATAPACPAGVVGIGPNGQDGSVGRNALYGPPFVQADLSLSRDFQIHENLVLQLRGEALNAFNIVNLNNPGSTLGTSTFGVISGAGTMRELQVGARLTF
jgi:hypothetical protein